MHPLQAQLEEKLQRMCNELDNHLEDQFGSLFTRHPNRLPRGKAANPKYDGLFSTGTIFTLGYGTKFGRGYILDVEIRTLENVSDSIRERINLEAFDFISTKLKLYFPNRDLKVVQDANVLKIVGNFSLGTVY